MKGSSHYAPSIKNRGYVGVLSEFAKSSRERVSLQRCSTPLIYCFEDTYREKHTQESGFSDLGLVLLGLFLDADRIKRLERRLS